MRKVLVFNNFCRNENEPAIANATHTKARYVFIKPKILFADPAKCRGKHMKFGEFIRRLFMCVVLVFKSWRYDVLLVDTTVTGFFMCLLLYLKRKPRLVIYHFNVLRRRQSLFRRFCIMLFKRLDHAFVVTKRDCDIVNELYDIPKEKLSFLPYVRSTPTRGAPASMFSAEKSPYILTYGVNARDHKTLLAAAEGIGRRLIIITRPYTVKGLFVPDNVSLYYNIPLDECDRLVDRCQFTVFAFDGSEPACGLISIVTSLMLGKPVISTDIPCVHDYVRDGYNGLFVKAGDPVELRDKILSLSRDDELLRRLSDGAAEWARANTLPDAIGEKVDDVVLKITNG
jgi:glycosyltransferase involved in cell wall biosynthesis